MKHQLVALLTVMCAACSVALSAESAAPSIEGTIRHIDASREAGGKVWATYPIFHQIVAFSFPQGFVPSYEVTKPPSYLQESVLLGETVEKWTQMISVTGLAGAAGEEHSEDMLLIVLKGDQDYYTIQWAERGQASPMPMAYDEQKWSDRIRQLTPFRVCQRLAGEAAPYPSCITPKM